MPGYVTLRSRWDFVEHDTVLAEYGGDTAAGRRKYRNLITEDLTAGLAIRDQIIGQSILGSEGFVSWVRENFLDQDKDRERPDVRKIHQYLSMEAVLGVVEKETGAHQVLQSSGTTRQIVMTALYTYAGLNNREIGDILRVDYSTISQGRKRLREKAEKDKKITLLLGRIHRELSKIKI